MIFQNERKTKKVRVLFQGSMYVEDEANGQRVFVLYVRLESVLCFVCLFVCLFSWLLVWKPTWSIGKGILGIKKPNQHKVHENLIIFHINICFLKLEILGFKISCI